MKKITFYLSLPLLYLIALLPFPLLYLFSDFLRFVLFDLIGYRNKVIISNLKNSFPEKTEAEIQSIANDFKRNLTDMILESVKMLTISGREIEKRFPQNLEIIKKYHAQGRSVVCIVGHLINWEWGGLTYSKLTDLDTVVVYKPLSNPYFDKLVLGMRSRFGAVLVPMKNALRKLAEYRDKPFTLVIVGDQYPGKKEGVYQTSFLNQNTYVHMGTEKMAKMMNSVVVFCDIQRKARGYYEVNYVPLVEDPKNTAENEITEMHVKYLEKVIQRAPAIWLWSHRRWK